MFKLMKNTVDFFDRLEDKIRGHLSKYPIPYAIIGGIGIVLFWRGVWHLADDFNLSSFASLVLGTVILLLVGLFTSMFIGDHIILSGLRHEKKVTDTTEKEVETEKDILQDIQEDIHKVRSKLR
ncbi:MAG: hypothetical protein ACYC5G_00985 [Candidatus Doudnabacteria bacterium]